MTNTLTLSIADSLKAVSQESEIVGFLRDLIAIPAESCQEGPVIQRIRREMEKVGLLTNALGGEPILGPVDRFPGLYVCFALHSGGWGYNPVAGFLMAEHVAEGKTSIDVRSFSPNRSIRVRMK